MEQEKKTKPFNDHTPLPWKDTECENSEPDGSRLVTWDINAEDEDGFTFVAEFSKPEDAAFARHAASTYYDREEALHKVVEAAQAVVDRWDGPLWKDVPHTGEFIGRLREALSPYTTKPIEP